MKTRATKNIARRFERPANHFASLNPQSIAALASGGADIVLIVSKDSEILDVAYEDLALSTYGLDKWAGSRWRDTVTPECYDKIADLFAECAETGESRWHQVNHPAEGMPDLPVNYKLCAVPDVDWKIAYGRELRQLAQMQQQLVHSQMELDREYRKIRETETRYRSAFQKLDKGIFVVTGADQKIVDLNSIAADMVGENAARLSGQPLKSIAARSDRQKLTAAVSEASSNGTPGSVRIESAQGTEMEIRIEPFREHGAVSCILLADDVLSEDRGSRRENGARDCYAALPVAMAIIDPNGVISEVNSDFLDLIRSPSQERAVGRNINKWIGQSNIESQMLIGRAIDERQVKDFSTTLRDELDNEIAVRVSAAIVKRGNKEEIALMISERRQNENQLTVSTSGAATSSSDFSELVGSVPLKELIREAADVIEKLCIEAALKQTRNNRASAAEMLGLSRQSLYIKLRRHGLESYDGQG